MQTAWLWDLNDLYILYSKRSESYYYNNLVLKVLSPRSSGPEHRTHSSGEMSLYLKSFLSNSYHTRIINKGDTFLVPH